jgi:hypothetical protein
MLPYRYGECRLCITAKIGRRWQRWVRSGGRDLAVAAAHVRFAPKADD